MTKKINKKSLTFYAQYNILSVDKGGRYDCIDYCNLTFIVSLQRLD